MHKQGLPFRRKAAFTTKPPANHLGYVTAPVRLSQRDPWKPPALEPAARPRPALAPCCSPPLLRELLAKRKPLSQACPPSPLRCQTSRSITQRELCRIKPRERFGLALPFCLAQPLRRISHPVDEASGLRSNKHPNRGLFWFWGFFFPPREKRASPHLHLPRNARRSCSK